MASGFRHYYPIACFFFLNSVYAQRFPTVTTVPPLQWLNITSLLLGATPPAVKYASIGFDPTTSKLIIFGGESSSGIPTDQTFMYVQLLLLLFILVMLAVFSA